MLLSKALELGSCGVQWQPPDGAIGEHTESQLAIRDDHGLTWRIAVSPIEFAIAPGEEAALAEDIGLSSRAAFELRWRSKPRPAGAVPRTESGDWSPVIEAKLGAVGESRIARVVRRLAYEQGDEAIIGHLFVPVAGGTVEIRVGARSAETGQREHAISTKYGGKQAQATYDAAELDPYFPDHPLTRIRAALDATITALDVTKPVEPRPAEVALSEPGAAIAPPARFVASPAIAGSGRGEVVRLGVDGWRRTVHVTRVGRPKFKGRDTHANLVEHADKDAADSSKTGASQIRSHSAAIDDYGVCAQIQQYVMYERDAAIRHAVQRWWLAGDGTVWRIGTDAPAEVDRGAMLDELAIVQDSFRRI